MPEGPEGPTSWDSVEIFAQFFHNIIFPIIFLLYVLSHFPIIEFISRVYKKSFTLQKVIHLGCIAMLYLRHLGQTPMHTSMLSITNFFFVEHLFNVYYHLRLSNLILIYAFLMFCLGVLFLYIDFMGSKISQELLDPTSLFSHYLKPYMDRTNNPFVEASESVIVVGRTDMSTTGVYAMLAGVACLALFLGCRIYLGL